MAKYFDHQYIQRVHVQNIGGVVDIEIYGGMVNEIAGPCAAGKTSLLRAMQMALGGIRAYAKGGKSQNSLAAKSAHPIRRGEPEGEVELETDDFVIRLVLTDGKDPYLRIKGKHGGTFGRKDLAGWLNKLTFDPTEFASWSEAKQLEVFRDLAGETWCQRLDEIDAEESEVAAERLALGRNIKAAGETPEEPERVEVPDTAALMKKLEEANTFNQAQVDQHRKRYNMAGDCNQIRDEIEALELQITDAKKRLQQAEAALKAEAMEIPTIDTAPIQDRITHASEMAAQAAAWPLWDKERKAREAMQASYEAADAKIAKIRSQRAEHMGNARLPVDGVSFGDGRILVNGLPLTELSGGEMIDLCADVMIAAHPEFNVMFCQRGEQLDQAMFERLLKKADEATPPIQLWIATVCSGGDGHGEAIHIYEGRVVEEAPEAAE